MAHIHGVSTRTGTAGVVLTLPLGSFTQLVFAVTPQLQTALAVANGDTSAYFNLHTTPYPSGEIRGQLTGVLLLLLLAAAAPVGVR